jgi:hypothetical protein
MRERWLAEIYQTIKKTRNEHLSQALSLLDKKAASDPEVAEAVSLLRPWVTDQGQFEGDPSEQKEG